VIRLRNQPDAPKGSGTIYRYDRDGLVAALAAASRAVPVAGAAA
jgi:two-component system chemotaxis sensor kinase CheA